MKMQSVDLGILHLEVRMYYAVFYVQSEQSLC